MACSLKSDWLAKRLGPTSAIARWRSSPFARNAGRVFAGGIAVQAITIAVAPINTRLYGPEVLGVVAEFSALAGVMSAGLAFRYDSALAIPQEQADAENLLRVAWWLTFAMFGICFVSVILLRDVAGVLARIGGLVWLLPVAALVATLNLISQNWAIRRDEFRIVVQSRLVTAVVTALFGVGAALGLGGDGRWLMVAAVLGAACGGVRLLTALVRLGQWPLLAVNRKWLPLGLGVAREFRQFPMFTLPMSVFDLATQSAPIWVLSGFFSPSVAGNFVVASSTLRLPAAAVGGAIAQVFFPKAARLVGNPRELYRLMWRISGVMAACGICLILASALLGPWAFALVFGRKWVLAGEYSFWIACMVGCNLITVPLATLPALLHCQPMHLLFAVGSFTMRLAALAAGVLLGSAAYAVVLYCCVEAVGSLLFCCWIFLRVRALPGDL